MIFYFEYIKNSVNTISIISETDELLLPNVCVILLNDNVIWVLTDGGEPIRG